MLLLPLRHGCYLLCACAPCPHPCAAAYFTYTVVGFYGTGKITYQQALAAVFVSDLGGAGQWGCAALTRCHSQGPVPSAGHIFSQFWQQRQQQRQQKAQSSSRQHQHAAASCSNEMCLFPCHRNIVALQHA